MHLLRLHIRILIALIFFPAISIYAQNNKCPENIGFENGNLSNWQFMTGSYRGIAPILNVGPATPGRHTLMTGGTDFYGGFPVIAPGGGNYSLKLGNSSIGAEAEAARYYIRIPQNAGSFYIVNFHYALVCQDPEHPPANQPRLHIQAYDSATGSKIVCNDLLYISGPTLPNFIQSTVDTTVYYMNWNTGSLNFKSVAGRTLILEFVNTDCAAGGHFGYSYIDVDCKGGPQLNTLYCITNPTITLNGTEGFKSYSWIDSATKTVLSNAKTFTTPTPLTSKTFGVIVTPNPSFGCYDTFYVNYIIDPIFVAAGGDQTICAGDTAQLSATFNRGAEFTFNWTPSTGLSCTNCINPKASPPNTTTYVVQVTDDAGCTSRDTVTVYVDKSMFPEITIKNDSVCTYDTLNAAIVNGLPGMQYIWGLADIDGDLLFGVNDTAIKARWKTYGIKTIVLKRVYNRCNITDSIEAYIKHTPVSNFDIKRDVCIKEEVTLWPYEEAGSVYKWEITEQDILEQGYQSQIKITWETIGTKYITQTVNLDGCMSTISKSTSVHELPIARISGDHTNFCYGKPFTLSTNEGDRYTYAWTPPQYFTGNNSASVSGKAEMSNFIHLLVTNTWGCSSMDSIYLDVTPCCEIVMADAFSPNGDGVNDVYRPRKMEDKRLISWMVANRRGQVLFQTNNINDSWDGKYQGAPVGQDTYHYHIKYNCEGEGDTFKKGNFILIR